MYKLIQFSWLKQKSSQEDNKLKTIDDFLYFAAIEGFVNNHLKDFLKSFYAGWSFILKFLWKPEKIKYYQLYKWTGNCKYTSI